MAHSRKKIGLRSRCFLRCLTCSLQVPLGLDLLGDLGFDTDKTPKRSVGVGDRADVSLDPVRLLIFGVIQDLELESAPLLDAISDVAGNFRICVGAVEQACRCVSALRPSCSRFDVRRQG